LSISDAQNFNEWFAGFYEKTGDFTMLAVLTNIGERSVTPLCSTYFHIVGQEVDWDELTVMFAGSGQPWNGVAFFPTKGMRGGPVDNPTAHLRLRELEIKVSKDRMILNEGYFFDAKGRKIQIEPLADS
jgi:hypothetical protein